MRSEDLLRMREWRELFETLPVLRRFFAQDGSAHGINALMDAVTQYLEQMLSRVDEGKPFVWYNLGFTSELIYALGGEVFPITVEALGVMHSLLGNHGTAVEFIDTSQAHGVSSDCCSADKLAAGALHLGLYPRPACTVGINIPCDAQVMNTQIMAELAEAPFFPIDVPYHYDDLAVAHVAGQLERLIPFLEQATGRTVDIERLREVCEYTNQMTEALWDWLEWRKMVPLAQSSKLVGLALVTHILFAGSELGVSIARALLREAEERTNRGERFFQERVRAVWYQDPVWTDFQIYDWFERDLGLTVPVDIFGYYAHEALIDTSDLHSMLNGLARRIVRCHPMSRQFRGSMDIYIRDFMDLVQGWQADCCIFAGHIACKHAWGGIGLFKEALRRADIPLLIFEFDMFDPRITPYEDVFFEVERFVNEIAFPHKQRRLEAAPTSTFRQASSEGSRIGCVPPDNATGAVVSPETTS